jgi:hypothetical protein
MGIGRCCAIEGGGVFARLDSLIAKRLAPESAWNRSGGSVLRLPPRALCSVRRPPRVDEELFLDSMKLEHAAPAELDLLGNGKFEGGGLRVILAAMTPTAAAPAPGAQLVFCGEADELQ